MPPVKTQAKRQCGELPFPQWPTSETVLESLLSAVAELCPAKRDAAHCCLTTLAQAAAAAVSAKGPPHWRSPPQAPDACFAPPPALPGLLLLLLLLVTPPPLPKPHASNRLFKRRRRHRCLLRDSCCSQPCRGKTLPRAIACAVYVTNTCLRTAPSAAWDSSAAPLTATAHVVTTVTHIYTKHIASAA